MGLPILPTILLSASDALSPSPEVACTRLGGVTLTLILGLRGGSGGGIRVRGGDEETVLARGDVDSLLGRDVEIVSSSARAIGGPNEDGSPSLVADASPWLAAAFLEFHSRYTLSFTGSSFTGSGFGATYPMDITAPLWLAWIPGMLIVLACGCMRIGCGGVELGAPASAALIALVVLVRAKFDCRLSTLARTSA